MKYPVPRPKIWIFMVVAEWLVAVSLYLAPMPVAFAETCVQVPRLAPKVVRSKTVPTNAEILLIMRQQGPSDEFPKGIEVHYLGSAIAGSKKYHVVYTSWVWDHGVRETQRLVFFTGDWRYLGNYGDLLDPPNRMCGNVLYWPYSSKLGNKIVFGISGPPNKVFLDGEFYWFEAGKD